MKSKEFNQPNEALKEAYKANIKARDQRELLLKEHELIQISNEIKAEINVYSSQDPKDEQALSQQAKELAEKKEQIYRQQQQRKTYQIKREQKEKLDEENQKQDIDMKVNSAELNQLKEDEDDDDLDKISQENGKTKGKKIKSDMLVKKEEEIINMKDNINQNTAEVNELNSSHKTLKESRVNKELGENRARLEQSNELVNATKEANESIRQTEIAKGKSGFYKTKEFNQTDQEIARVKVTQKVNDKQRQQIELADKQQEAAARSLHELEVAQNTRGIDNNDVVDEAAIAQQVAYTSQQIEEEEKHRREKERMVTQINDLIGQREQSNDSNNWNNFVKEDKYREYTNFTYTPYAFDESTMKQIYNDFVKYTHKSKFNMPPGYDGNNNDNFVNEEEES